MINVDEWVTKFNKQERQAHLNLQEQCVERGGTSRDHRGVLAQYLNTTMPTTRVCLCHACHNGKCSNPKHLYWGTYSDNLHDAHVAGRPNISESLEKKYGKEGALRMRREAGRKGGLANRGKKISDEHKKNISESLRNRNNDS